MKETTLVTGASSGIGFEMAICLAHKGHNLVLTARSEFNLKQLKDLIVSKCNVDVLLIPKDLSINNSAKELYNEIIANKIEVTNLINNAGFGEYGPFYLSNIEREKQMIQLNITSLVELTKLFLIDMKKNNYGKIMNTASVVAFFPFPLFSVYASTKAFVLSFSEGLRNELANTNISVTCLCPGATKSNFTKNSEMDDTKAYKYMKQATSKQVAVYGIKAMLKGKGTVIYGLSNKLLIFSTRFAPRWIVVKISSFISAK